MTYRSVFVAVVLSTSLACASGEPQEPAAETLAAPRPGDAHDATAAHGTLEEAAAMIELAAAHYEQVGRAAALADFTADRPPFIDRDLYVFCYGPERTISAHGADPGLIGVAIDELRDVDGKAFGTEIYELGNQEGGGTVEYHWLNPVTGEVEPKVSVVRQMGEDVCGVGAYRGR